jgi:hypothetical protein
MKPLSVRSRTVLLSGIAIIALVLPALAFGQATRTWVSGVGDDANPCSRTAPCKTFPGAISKTATGGEINCLDPGGFGGVTITKAITIKCQYTEGGVLVSGTNAIVINAPNTASVVLRGLDINGLGTGLNGVRVLGAKNVQIIDTEIYGFTQNGVDFEPSTAGAQLLVVDSHIHDNGGNGVLNAPQSTGSPSKAVLRRNLIAFNTCGVVAAEFGANNSTFGTDCGTAANAQTPIATVNSFENTITNNSFVGVFSRGTTATNRIGLNQITNNTTGLAVQDSGKILSWGNNFLGGNGTDGAPTGPVIPPI